MDPSDFDDLFKDSGDEAPDEDLDAGGGYLLDLVSAVTFLRRGDRHGLTVWDAIEEAMRWWTAEAVSTVAGVPDPDAAELRWGDPDPLHGTMAMFLLAAERTRVFSEVGFQQAIRRWVATMSALHNDGQPWPAPRDERGFPPPVPPAHLM